ncbi:LamB/YcsF family protein [Erwinia mallotivora]|uniref:LamB/YcsF family protein n=1 Tax=Erwinia mallotivora TaxID=69222 RepID=UPI0021C15669|nr:5-oxoprolinase subunit PxpA [Erwinia mallotivora]
MKFIDLNADIGEGFGDYTIADDAALMPLITSANVACGFHAGDAVIMANTVALAKKYQVDLGAHVGFPDLAGFGRRRMHIEPEVMAHYVTYQLGALSAFARAADYPLTHMSFHGALGNMVSEDAALAQVLLQAVSNFDAKMIVSTLPGNAVESAARALNLPVVCTFLADRAYESNGLLVSRSKPGAVIHDKEQVRTRVRQLLREGTVESIDGITLPVNATSILVHGDTPESLGMVRTLREIIAEMGIVLMPPGQQQRQLTEEKARL